MGRKFFVGGNFKMQVLLLFPQAVNAHDLSLCLPRFQTPADLGDLLRNGTISSIKEIVHNLSTAKLGMLNSASEVQLLPVAFRA